MAGRIKTQQQELVLSAHSQGAIPRHRNLFYDACVPWRKVGDRAMRPHPPTPSGDQATVVECTQREELFSRALKGHKTSLPSLGAFKVSFSFCLNPACEACIFESDILIKKIKEQLCANPFIASPTSSPHFTLIVWSFLHLSCLDRPLTVIFWASQWREQLRKPWQSTLLLILINITVKP